MNYKHVPPHPASFRYVWVSGPFWIYFCMWYEVSPHFFFFFFLSVLGFELRTLHLLCRCYHLSLTSSPYLIFFHVVRREGGEAEGCVCVCVWSQKDMEECRKVYQTFIRVLKAKDDVTDKILCYVMDSFIEFMIFLSIFVYICSNFRNNFFRKTLFFSWQKLSFKNWSNRSFSVFGSFSMLS